MIVWAKRKLLLVSNRLKGWRTIAFGGFAAALSIASMPEVAGVMPAHWLPWLSLIVAIGTMLMRKITTTPMGRR